MNRIPLPAIPDRFGVRLPPFEYQTTLPNLQWAAEEEPARDDDKPSGVSLSPAPPSSSSRCHCRRYPKYLRKKDAFPPQIIPPRVLAPVPCPFPLPWPGLLFTLRLPRTWFVGPPVASLVPEGCYFTPKSFA